MSRKSTSQSVAVELGVGSHKITVNVYVQNESTGLSSGRWDAVRSSYVRSCRVSAVVKLAFGSGEPHAAHAINTNYSINAAEMRSFQ